MNHRLDIDRPSAIATQEATRASAFQAGPGRGCEGAMAVPWFAKMAAKLVLARMPLPHGFWFRLGLFRHGHMQDFEYARGVLNEHLKLAGLEGTAGNASKVVLELGPGESLFTAAVARASGFSGSILLDAGDFALPEAASYKKLAAHLEANGASLPDISGCGTIESILERLNARYLIEGVVSMKTIPDGSVDFIFSQAVLEHLRRREVAAILGEMRRILKPGGVSTHIIDLKDHFQSSLNNLRFSEAFWESDFVWSSGFYTNRLRYHEWIEMFITAGFEVEVLSKNEWPAMPLSKKKLSPHFQNMPDKSLCISEMSVQLR